MKQKINWRAVWAEFDKWYESEQLRCDKCHHVTDAPEWPRQKMKLREIVERRLADR